MQDIKISLVNDDLLSTSCSVAVIKHRESRIWGPEKEIDEKLNGRLTSLYRNNEKLDHIIVHVDPIFPFPYIYIINFHREDLPFTYSSIDTYARKIIRLAIGDERAVKIGTTVHGLALGLDASEALETMLSAFASELRYTGATGSLQEILIVEKDQEVFPKLQERMQYLLNEGNVVCLKGELVYLNLTSSKEIIALEQSRFESLSLAPIFVAMPFAREYNNVYYFGIKDPVERHKRKCERVDEDKFTGDIIDRIKQRIAASELVIADTTGRNPNVFYEVGYAEGVGKKVILLSQDKEIPFDLRTQRHIIYDPQDIMSLAKEVGGLLDALLVRNS